MEKQGVKIASRVAGGGFVNEIADTGPSKATKFGANGEKPPAKKRKRRKKNKKQEAKRRKLEAARAAKPETDAEREKRERDETIIAEYMASCERGRQGTLSDRLNAKHMHFDAPLQGAWKSMSKKARKVIVAHDANRLVEARHRVRKIKHAFEAEKDDHCETDPLSFAHIVPLLNLVAQRLGKEPAALNIYDPYYCAGACKVHLAALGFPNVYNENEDAYSKWDSSEGPPEHDVLVTNPPFSGDHIHKLLHFCRANGKPFLLLMPNYVCSKPYYAAQFGRRVGDRLRAPRRDAYEAAAAAADAADAKGDSDSDDEEEAAAAADAAVPVLPLLLVPRKRYNFWTPKGLRGALKTQKQHAGPNGTRTSPFVTFWYLDLFPTAVHADVTALFTNPEKPFELLQRGTVLYDDAEALPLALKDDDGKRS